jgi:chromosome segregation ATPase
MAVDDRVAEDEQERTQLAAMLVQVESRLAIALDELEQLRAADAELKHWDAERQRELADAHAELAQARARTREREIDIEDLTNRLDRAAGTIDDITSSFSWRLTSPLRSVKRLLG